MKRIIASSIAVALLAVAPLASVATTFFSDNFADGSTLSSLTPAEPTTNSTSYQLSSSKSWNPTPSLTGGDLKFGIGTTTGGGIELQGLFTTNPVALVLPGDYIRMTVTFTNTAGLLTAAGLWGFGLYNAAQVAPLAGGLNATALNTVSDKVTGGVQNWQGYWGQRGFTGENSRIVKRLPQTAGTDNRNQNLTSTGSGTQSYASPAGATVGSASTTPSGALVVGNTYTVVLRIDLIAENTLAITNTYYDGPDTTGTVVSTFGAQASGADVFTSAFDGLGIGWRARANTTGGTVMDISSITVDGSATVITTPPDIVTQPVPVTVPSGGSCAYSVVAQGFGMTYQWHRYATNLVNGGNISGATSPTLVISPASAADVASGANGYYVTIKGTGGYSTNSVTCSLTLGTASDLVWSGSGTTWDLGTSASWLKGGNPATFNYGDAVTFNDTGSASLTVTLAGNYLSASSVTVDASPGVDYVFAGTGSFAGPGTLVYKGAGLLTMNSPNSYSGGTIISNAAAYLVLNNYNALGVGPVTLAKAGGQMEIVPVGSASVGINGDLIVADDFAITYDGDSAAYGIVLLGNLAGTVGKTLTLNRNSANTAPSRVRIYGTDTVCDANLNLTDSRIVLAPYQASGGSQVYNGVISGVGALVQRGNSVTILKGPNTYSGGTTPTTGTIGFGIDSTGAVDTGPIGTGPLFLAPETPNLTGSGTVLAWEGARTIANPIQYPSGTNNLTLIIGGTNALTFSGPITLNGNDGLGGPANRVFQVNNTALTTFSGVISDVGSAGFGLTKTGNGTLALDNTETYTGPTTVSAGTLQVNGQLAAASAVTVATNAILAGTGTIGGSVTVNAGGAIAPGTSIGTLSIGGNLSLAGNLSIEVNKSASPTSDKVVVGGTLNNTGTGTITVANVGPALVQGDSFSLFDGKLLANGGALSVTGANVIWTNKLATDGTIEVSSLIATTPTNISYSLSGTNLTLSWPPNYLTWTLQSNAVSVVAATNWYAVPNSSNVTSIVIPVYSSRSNVFYRLLRP